MFKLYKYLKDKYISLKRDEKSEHINTKLSKVLKLWNLASRNI